MIARNQMPRMSRLLLQQQVFHQNYPANKPRLKLRLLQRLKLKLQKLMQPNHLLDHLN